MTDGKETDNLDTDQTPEPEIIEAEVIKEDVAPSPSPQPPPQAKPASKMGWISAAVLAAFIGGVYAAPYFEEGLITLGLKPAPVQSPAGGTQVDLSSVEASISNLDSQLARHQQILAQHEQSIASSSQAIEALQERPAGAEQPIAALAPAELANLKDTVDRLSSDITQLATLNKDSNPAVTQLTGSIALLKAEAEQMRARFASLETAISDLQAGSIDASPRGRLMLALGRIKERALKGFAFDSDIAALRPDIAALTALDQQLVGAELAILSEVSSGITPYETLVQEFDQMAAAALQSAQKEEGNFLSNLFTVRRTDAGATGNDAIFLKAEKRLIVRDIAGAVEALSELTGAALQGTETWRSQATTLTRVQSAFERMTTAISNASLSGGENG